jgi:hypothetical protein
LRLPEDEEVGGKLVRKAFNPTITLRTCWELMSKAVEVDELLGQDSGITGRTFDMIKLGWRGIDSTLDWVAYDTTIQGKRRDWGLLAGLARVRVGVEFPVYG